MGNIMQRAMLAKARACGGENGPTMLCALALTLTFFRILAAELQRLSAVRLDFHMDARSERVCRRSGACRYRRIVVLEVAFS